MGIPRSAWRTCAIRMTSERMWDCNRGSIPATGVRPPAANPEPAQHEHVYRAGIPARNGACERTHLPCAARRVGEAMSCFDPGLRLSE